MIRSCACFLLVLCLAETLAAQSRPVDLRIAVGRCMPLSGLVDNEYGHTNAGFGASLLIGYAFTPRLSLALEATVIQMNNPERPEDWGIVLVPLEAKVRYRLPAQGKVRPYASASAGLVNEALSIPAEQDPLNGDFTVATVGVGAGFYYPIADHAAVDIGAAYHFGPTHGKKAMIEGESIRIPFDTNYLSVMMGLDFEL